MRGDVLVALLKTPEAFRRARDDRWYHVPVGAVKRRLKDRWPPRIIGFYQGHPHGSEAFCIRHFAVVVDIHERLRRDLFPEQSYHPNAEALYYKVVLDKLQSLERPIRSRRLRRIVFIPTTWGKFVSAVEINDLYDESPLEDYLWSELKSRSIFAERQEYVLVNDREYALDFAVYGVTGNLDIETDGDTWHGKRERIAADNVRDNDLETAGWKLLRFNTRQVREQLAEYCIPTIGRTINQIGGLVDDGPMARRFDEGRDESQLDLFGHAQGDSMENADPSPDRDG